MLPPSLKKIKKENNYSLSLEREATEQRRLTSYQDTQQISSNPTFQSWDKTRIPSNDLQETAGILVSTFKLEYTGSTSDADKLFVLTLLTLAFWS